jgi:pilus assembly protein CpaB
MVVEQKVATSRIVVAAEPLRFGMELSQVNLKEVDWGTTTLPPGAFNSLSDLLKPNERRVVLTAIEPNEPILPQKITGPGQRAALSALIDSKLKAATVRVNDVFGVAGFVLPGDRVDVMFTRVETNAGDSKKFTDVLLQNVRVLAIDQLADDRSDKPAVVKAVTLEVETEDAQKLALAGTVGSLSLVLRSAGTDTFATAHRVTADELGSPPVARMAQDDGSVGKVLIRRGVNEPNSYMVPLERGARSAAASAGGAG